MQETRVQSLDWEDLLEKGMAAHSSILAWEIPGGLQSMRSHRVGHDSVTKTTNKFEKPLRHLNEVAWWQLAI